jgi:cytochrome c biogenesis protein CcmG, thiol:disulfide interchange protein DsbE
MKKYSKRSLTILLAAAGWIVFSFYFITIPSQMNISAPKEGFLAPNFDLEGIDGSKIQLEELRGSPIVINFWASWCPPCRAEMPALQRVTEKYNDQNLHVLAVNLTDRDNISSVEKFIKSYGLTFPVLFDRTGGTASAYRIKALPTTYFINENGIISDIIIGGPMTEPLIQSKIEKMLQDGS